MSAARDVTELSAGRSIEAASTKRILSRCSGAVTLCRPIDRVSYWQTGSSIAYEIVGPTPNASVLGFMGAGFILS